MRRGPQDREAKIDAHRKGVLGEDRAERAPVAKNTDVVRDLVAQAVRDARGRITAKRLLPIARTAGYTGSARNFRRLVASIKRAYKLEQGRHQRRPAVWAPGDTLVIDWGTLSGVNGGGLHVFCAVLAWCRVRFVRVARDETAATTHALLAECFEQLGGVPAKVLADRMGCLKGGVVANVVIPTPDYVRFATHYRFTPDFCHPADPESKGIVEHLSPATTPTGIQRSHTTTRSGSQPNWSRRSSPASPPRGPTTDHDSPDTAAGAVDQPGRRHHQRA